MKKQIALAVAVLVVILAGFYILGNKKGVATDTSKPIKIGLILPLTGSVAYIGEAAKNGAELAMDKINNDTSLKHKYQLVIEDDSLDAKKTASAINKLISIDKVNTVISVSSGSGNIVTPIAEQNKLPHIGMASDANVAKGDYNYIHWTQPNEEVEKLVAELQKRNIKKVAMLEVNQQGFLATSLILREKIKGTGITIVSDEIFNTGETNFKTIILRSQKTNPDIYLLGAFSPEIEILGKQMKDLNINTPITSIESFSLTDNPAMFEGRWFIDSAVSTDGFSESYNKKYNKNVGVASGNAYDAINLFVRAVESTNNSETPSGQEITNSLGKISDYSGAFGQLIIDRDGIIRSQPSVKIIREGKAVVEK